MTSEEKSDRAKDSKKDKQQRQRLTGSKDNIGKDKIGKDNIEKDNIEENGVKKNAAEVNNTEK